MHALLLTIDTVTVVYHVLYCIVLYLVARILLLISYTRYKYTYICHMIMMRMRALLLVLVARVGHARQVALGSTGQQQPVGSSCIDESLNCAEWARLGECNTNPVYMRTGCPASCNICAAPMGAPKIRSANCEDKNVRCATWAAIGECDTNPNFMLSTCPVTCRLCQSATCNDSGEDCTARSANAGCYTDPTMLTECAWTCLGCELASRPQCTRPRVNSKRFKPEGTKSSTCIRLPTVRISLPTERGTCRGRWDSRKLIRAHRGDASAHHELDTSLGHSLPLNFANSKTPHLVSRCPTPLQLSQPPQPAAS